LSLIEVVIAMVIFAIVASAVIAGLAGAMKTARLDKNRVAAANLAARELEITRNEFNDSAVSPTALAAIPVVVNPHALPGQTAGADLQVDGIPYQVTRTVGWQPAGTGQSSCDGGSAVTYPKLAVNVTVSWPSMGSIPPVTSNTVLTPKKGILASSLSFVAVKVLRASGLPNQNVLVTLTGPGGTSTGTTDAAGCAVLSATAAGAYTASLNTAGYVDYYGSQSASKAVTVTSGSLTQVQFSYDLAATLAVTLGTEGGFALPGTLPKLTLSNTGLQPLGTKVFSTSGATTTIPSLWPFTDGYGVWAGSCAQSDPAAAGGTRSPSVVMAPGATGSTSVRLAPVDVTVRTFLGLALPNAVVTATPASTTGCDTTENPLVLGTTDAAGRLRTSLPSGVWQLRVNGRTPSGSWPSTPTLLPTSPVTSMTVVTN
jgi:type II secretory pathway pseudopilin PulG